ncbi:MAG: Uma2 family endonuclease [Fimbriiglobus sp.]
MLAVDHNRAEMALIYPESDGELMSDNTRQAEWIVRIFTNLTNLFHHRDDVFVAIDHLIYPVKGKPKVRLAPDVYVVFGRPKGHRGSYRVFDEAGVFPQVVFEILSPKNTAEEMNKKRAFYFKYGAEECYIYDPDSNQLEIWTRAKTRFVRVKSTKPYVSPRLAVTFDQTGEQLTIRYPNGREFVSLTDVTEELELTKEQLHLSQQRLIAEKAIADAERIRAAKELEALRAKLRAMGIDPEVS